MYQNEGDESLTVPFLPSFEQDPKSASLTWPLTSRRTLSGLTSLQKKYAHFGSVKAPKTGHPPTHPNPPTQHFPKVRS